MQTPVAMDTGVFLVQLETTQQELGVVVVVVLAACIQLLSLLVVGHVLVKVLEKMQGKSLVFLLSPVVTVVSIAFVPLVRLVKRREKLKEGQYLHQLLLLWHRPRQLFEKQIFTSLLKFLNCCDL
eukprot:TRINITY_DN1181_c1_g2_i1.p4 TRINITY_DN1181_c1_g2~~TRINITY_DN1181_c1_g2_i1.p4  ORF type:complete len:125 (-),score=11.32 TRINITY_DN1181_c1_g2_i1:192-566(-)